MSRIRITARERTSADQTPYPGNVNQPGRVDSGMEDYHTFEPSTNHWTPDMRHEWKEDSHDDIGFGIPEAWGRSPTVASARVAANKAVRIAVLLLGEKVEDEIIEKQATDFMSMGVTAMDNTLARFADTQKLYASDEEEVTAEDEEEVTAKKDDKKAKKNDDKKAEDDEEVTAKKDDKKAEDEEEVTAKKDDKKSSDEEEVTANDDEKIVASIMAALPDFIQKKVDERKEKSKKKSSDEEEVTAKKKDDKKSSDEEEVTSKKEDDKKSSDEEDDEEVVANKKNLKKGSANELDIELTGGMDDEIASDPETEKRLASCFEDNLVAEDSTKKVEASQKKSGITKLGGQPRVMSASGTDEGMSALWKSAPNVSDVFN